MSHHQRTAPVGEYEPYPLAVATTTTDGQAIGALFTTTSATAVAAPGSATVILAAAPPSGFVVVGSRLYVYGTGTSEIVTITAINYATPSITAIFANIHSGPITLTTLSGTKLGLITVNQPGTTMVLALWNGLPSLVGASPPAIRFALIAPSTQPLWYFCNVRQGLFVTYTGTTPGDITIMALPDPISL